MAEPSRFAGRALGSTGGGRKNSDATHNLESVIADKQSRKRYKTLDFIKY
jgi:hypothetical protein